MKGLRGQGRIFERGEKHWIAYYVDGVEHRESAGNTRADAKRKLKARLNEIHSGTFIDPRKAKITVNELLDNYITHLKNKGAKSIPGLVSGLKPMRSAFGIRRAIDIKSPQIEKFISDQLNIGKKNSTINRGVSALRSAYNLAKRQNILKDVPYFTTLKEDNARQGFFEKVELEAIMPHLPSHLVDFVRFAYQSGWRKAEISSLTWGSVDCFGKEIRLRTSKNNEGRSLPIVGGLADIIERSWASHEDELKRGSAICQWVFHRNGKQIGRFDKAWKIACDKGGCSGKLFHDFRRTAVRNMTRAGTPETVAMQITGHKTNSMFRRYNITSQDDKRRALLETEKYLEDQPIEKRIIPLSTGTLPKN
jgi:integrase